MPGAGRNHCLSLLLRGRPAFIELLAGNKTGRGLPAQRMELTIAAGREDLRGWRNW